MSKMKIYILEDEIITQELLKDSLEQMGYSIVGVETNAERALEKIKLLQPDIAILDIRVEGEKTGLWLGEQLTIPIIYLTAFSDKKTIQKAINTKPISYLSKPFNNNNLYIAVELALNHVTSQKEITVKHKNVNIKIRINAIMFAKKEGHYLELYVANSDAVKLLRASVNEFLEMVSSDNFVQVHRSYVVNKQYVNQYSIREIFINDKKIPVSSTYAKEILDQLR